jgi:hypothetical protein
LCKPKSFKGLHRLRLVTRIPPFLNLRVWYCCAEVKDGVLFSFGDASDAASRRSSGVATLERPASGASSAAVPQNGASAGWAAVQSKAAYTEPGRVEAHPLVAIIALSELLIDSVSPSTRQTRKIKRSAMPPTPRGGSSSVTEKASLPGVALAFVATSVASAVGFIADVGMKRK